VKYFAGELYYVFSMEKHKVGCSQKKIFDFPELSQSDATVTTNHDTGLLVVDFNILL
jgi:hypothetical protein